MVMLHTFKVCGFTASCQRIVPPLTFINPTCSLYAYNSLILKYRFFEFRKMYHTNISSSL